MAHAVGSGIKNRRAGRAARSSSRRVRLLAIAAVLAGLLVAACGSSSGPDVRISGIAQKTATPRSAQATATPEPLPLAPEGDPFLLPLGKDMALADTYVPPDLVLLPERRLAVGGQMLRREAADALEEWLTAADEAGFDIKVLSGYRSYDEQVATFQYWAEKLGEAEAERSSARPGHSEHQLGTTVDLTTAAVGWDLVEGFGDTEEGRWLAATAADYGFVMSYPKDAEPITGYEYEPWHFRYVGRRHALAVQQEGLTLIEHLRRVAAGGG